MMPKDIGGKIEEVAAKVKQAGYTVHEGWQKAVRGAQDLASKARRAVENSANAAIDGAPDISSEAGFVSLETNELPVDRAHSLDSYEVVESKFDSQEEEETG